MADKHVIYAQGTSNHRLGLIDHGIRGADIPATGDAGPPPLYDDVTLPADNDVRFRMVLSALPSSGTLRMENDSSFLWPDVGETVADGSYTATGQRYRDGAADGSPETITLTMGATHAVASGGFADLSLTPATGSASVTATADASGSGAFAALGITAPTGAAAVSESASGSGAFEAISVSAPAGNASTGADADAHGAFAAISISVPQGSASVDGSVSASGGFVPITLRAPRAPLVDPGMLLVGTIRYGTPGQMLVGEVRYGSGI